jgi:hypothetical protein
MYIVFPIANLQSTQKSSVKVLVSIKSSWLNLSNHLVASLAARLCFATKMKWRGSGQDKDRVNTGLALRIFSPPSSILKWTERQVSF